MKNIFDLYIFIRDKICKKKVKPLLDIEPLPVIKPLPEEYKYLLDYKFP